MKKAIRKKLAKNRVTSKKKLAKRKAAPKNAKIGEKTGGKTVGALKKQASRESQSVDTVAFAPDGMGARSGEKSGDLQGLSNIQCADSESVDELLEEGNAFEAGIVLGIEDSRNREGQEVRTREVPEDDVPQEYLDPD
jgi:hypothetical protein